MLSQRRADAEIKTHLLRAGSYDDVGLNVLGTDVGPTYQGQSGAMKRVTLLKELAPANQVSPRRLCLVIDFNAGSQLCDFVVVVVVVFLDSDVPSTA